MTTALNRLRTRIAERFPGASLSLDMASSARGTSWLDIDLGGKVLHVAWSSTKGFGVSSDDPAAFGEGHDEVYPTLAQAWSRVEDLLVSGARTNPGIAGALRELREELHVPQTELANRMDVQQAAISKIERRQDLLLSTLRSFVSNLGGELELTVRFPDRTVPLLPRPHSKAGRKVVRTRSRRRQVSVRSGK